MISRREAAVAVAWGCLLLLLATVAPRFFLPQQVRSMLVANAPLLVMAVGMTLVILTRQIDISVGAQFCACGLCAALLAQQGFPLVVSAAAAIALGALLGAINGVLIAGLGLPSIVVTLASLVMLREGLRWWRQGEFVRNLPESFQWAGWGQTAGSWLVVGVAAVAWLVATWCLKYWSPARTLCAVGSDPEAARLLGLRPAWCTGGVFVVMGMLTGLAAVLNAIRFADLDPNAGLGLELQVIAAVVVGGTAVTGGRARLVGTLLGVGLLGSLGPALVFLHTQPEWEKALQGVIILAAVASESFTTGRRASAASSA
jgi:rhamnose transport system permease protein